MLLLDCRIYWNLIYFILYRVRDLRDTLTQFILTNTDNIFYLFLEWYEWKYIDYLLLILYNFYLQTRYVSRYHGITIQKIYKSIYRLIIY